MQKQGCEKSTIYPLAPRESCKPNPSVPINAPKQSCIPDPMVFRLPKKIMKTIHDGTKNIQKRVQQFFSHVLKEGGP